MKERIVYIINPISGTSDKKAIVEYINKSTDKNKFDCEVYYTKSAGDGYHSAKKFAESGYNRVVAVGGDGTVNEVARGLLRTDAALGIIPLGSGNGLARHLKIPLNYHKAFQITQGGEIISCDYGLLNNKPFFCTSGSGFDAQVGKRFARLGRRGFITYAQASFMEYFQYYPQNYKITLNGKTFSRKAFLITFANASQWGYNAYISPDASLNDGMLDLVIVSPFSFVKAPIIGIQMFTKNIYRSGNIEVFRFKELTIEREKPGYVHIDGDPVIDKKILHVKTITNELKIITPAGKHTPFKFSQFNLNSYAQLY